MLALQTEESKEEESQPASSSATTSEAPAARGLPRVRSGSNLAALVVE